MMANILNHKNFYILNMIYLNMLKVIGNNFFGEYYGKNLVDGHFGRLSQTFKEIELGNKINSIDQLLCSFQEKELKRLNNQRSTSSNINIQGKNVFHIWGAK